MHPFTHASWIRHPGLTNHEPRTVVFRLDFQVTEPVRVELAVSADQRYQLFLDGTRVGLGPERGDLSRWFYERYPLALESGPHRLTALCWSLAAEEMPGAQFTFAPGFLLASGPAPASRAADPAALPDLATGVAPWRVCEVHGITTGGRSHAVFCGPRYRIDGSAFDYRLVTGEATGANAEWLDAAPAEAPVPVTRPANRYGIAPDRLLAPAMLPHAIDHPFRAARCRWAATLRAGAGDSTAAPGELDRDARVLADSALADAHLTARASEFAAGARPLEVPRDSEYLVLLELETYYCAYPELVTRGGAGACVELGWAESLYEEREGRFVKGDRREIEGKLFTGDFDLFRPGGRDEEFFTTPWWRSGRYLLLRIRTGSDPIELRTLSFRETRQPVELGARFTASDPRLAAFIPVGMRSLQMCAHETLMDCPYYEQLQYVGDSRLEALVLYVAATSDALAKKCILQFDESRLVSGVTRASYPNHETQVIPGFSLHWISMVYDYARYRDDSGFVRDRLSGSRAVLDWYSRLVTHDGTVGPVPYWNFVDWATDWENGVPPAGADGASCVNSLEYADALGHAAALEEYAGEPEFAALYRRRRAALLEAVVERYWDESRGLFADTVERDRFSEHVQALALSLGAGSDDQRARVLQGLLSDGDLSRCTIYYSWYLFEALFAEGRAEAVLDRMEHWFGHHDRGLVTCAETPEPSRSDCHAWGSHPIWHYYASLAGIRPADWGFRRVRIVPCLGRLESLEATMPHPAGPISVTLARRGPRLQCTVGLPEGLSGELEWGGSVVALEPGEQTSELGG